MKICFFIGHREAPESLLPILDAEVKCHITRVRRHGFRCREVRAL